MAKIRIVFAFFLMGALLPSCARKESIASYVTPTTTAANAINSFSGVTSITNVGETTATVNWEDLSAAATYYIYQIVSEEKVLLETVEAPASSLQLQDLEVGVTYTIQVNALDSSSLEDDNTVQESFTTVSTESDSQSWSFASSDSFTFDNSKVTYSSSSFRLKDINTNSGTYTSDFSDGSTTDWSIRGSNVSLSEAGGSLTITGTSADFVPVYLNTVPNTGISNFEMNLTAQVSSGSKYLLAGGRIIASNSYYLLGINTASFWKYARVTGSWATMTSTPANPSPGFTLGYDENVNIKYRANGTQHQFKTWLASDSEPASWSFSSTDSSLSLAGDLGLIIKANTVKLSSFSVQDLDASSTPEYSQDSPSLVFPSVNITDTPTAYDSVSITNTAPSGSSILYDVSLNGGSTWLTVNGSSWVTNSSGVTNAVSLATLNSALSSLNVSSKSFTLRAFLVSSDGNATPSVSGGSLNYTIVSE